MYTKIISVFLVIALTNLLGCYSFVSIGVNEYEQFKQKEGTPKEIYVKTKDNHWYHFKDFKYKIENDTLYGNGQILLDGWLNEPHCKISLSDIESIGVEEMNMYTTSILVTLGVLSVIGIVVALVGLFTSDITINP